MLSRLRLSLVRPRIRLVCLGQMLVAALCLLPTPASASSATQSVEVVARIEPELSLSIEPETGSRIDFGTVRSSATEARLSEPVHVNVRVDSNLGRSYQVTQHLRDPLVNEDGVRLPPGQLLAGLQQEPAGLSAALDGLTEQPQVLITSDASGTPAAWSVSYQLRVPPDQPAGTYQGTVVMTVTAQ